MSASTRSKPASATSPATGDAEAPASRDTTEIELEVSRQRAIAWAIGGTIGGILMILKLGRVGVWAGYAVLAWGIVRAVQLALTIIYPPGTIKVSPTEVVLPRGAHRPNPLKLAPKDVTAVYFLRRSVPWNKSSPVLVIEVGDKAHIFPRDRFPLPAYSSSTNPNGGGLSTTCGRPSAPRACSISAALPSALACAKSHGPPCSPGSSSMRGRPTLASPARTPTMPALPTSFSASFHGFCTPTTTSPLWPRASASSPSGGDAAATARYAASSAGTSCGHESIGSTSRLPSRSSP